MATRAVMYVNFRHDLEAALKKLNVFPFNYINKSIFLK